MAESVAIDERDGPVEYADKAANYAECDGSDDVALSGFLLLRDTASLAKHVDKSHNQAAKAYGSKRVSHGSSSCTTRNASGHAARLSGTEVPRSIDACNSGVDGVLQPLTDPVTSKRDENE